MPSHAFFATCPRSLEDLLLDELRTAGAVEMKETVAGVRFGGTLGTAYHLCLWSRFASRVLLPIAEFPAATVDALLAGTRSVRWDEHLRLEDTFAVEASIASSALRHSDYAALVVKDGIADYFRSRRGRRPNVETRDPDVKIDLHLVHDVATLSIELSGGSLHRRSYRVRGVAAPLKENVAAAMLARARWPETALAGGALVDPMCGSGTLLIEGALMAGDVAPGLLRLLARGEGLEPAGLAEAAQRLAQGSEPARAGAGGRQGGSAGAPAPLQRWRGNDAAAWRSAVAEAARRCAAGIGGIPPIYGFDRDSGAVEAARANIASSGLADRIAVERGALSRLSVPSGRPGLLAVNPPYGRRLGNEGGVEPIYREIGRVLHARFRGWRACVLSGDLELSKGIGLRASKVNTLYNGPIRCVLSQFELTESNRFVEREAAEAEAAPVEARKEARGSGAAGEVFGGKASGRHHATGGVLAFVNRVTKNHKLLGKWARSSGITCYRLYDADLPDYSVALDYFEDRWLHVQEYVAPRSIDEEKAARRLEDVVTVLPEALGVAPENIFVKRRRRRRRTEQYTRLAAEGQFYEVHEGGYSFLVNFTDYLDTGLFLDHRPTRELIRREAEGKRFLNLFAYTCTASVYAAKGGALSTTSIDSSNTYLRWARENFNVNAIGGQHHRLLRADCWEWLHVDRDHYDLIFMDPPTFSNAKGKRATLDVQRDHAKIIRLAVERLAPGGTLLFSTNYRRFRMEEEALGDLTIEDISRETIPRDFSRNRHIHSCFRITRRGGNRGEESSEGERA